MSYFKNLSRLVSRNSQSSQASKEEVSPPSSGTTTSKASYGDPRRTDTPPPSIPEDARKTPEIRRRESLGVRMSSVINSSSKRKSEDKGSKRTRRDSSTPNRVNTHEIWSLQAPTPTTETTTRPISPPVSSRPPTPAIARPASPAVRHKESRLRLVHRGESAKSVLLKEKEHLTTRVHELTEQVHTLEERERTYQARCSNLETDLDRATSKYRSAKGDLEALLKEHNAAAEHTARHIQELTAQKQKVEAQLQQYEATAQVARQYQDLKVRYQQLDSRNQHLETRNQQAEAEVQQLRDQLRVAQSTAAAAAAVVQQQPSRQVQDLRTRNQQLEAQLHQAQAQLRQYESKHSETTALLDVRTAELKGAQAFLTKADSFSGADIIRMVEGLNSEIFQCCALVAETVFSEENIPKEDEKFVAGIRTELAGMHGEMLISFLAKNAVASRDPLPLQVALQMLLIKFCIHVVTSFDLDNAELNERLSFIYEQVVNTEEQSVAGRWRAITMGQMKPLYTSRMQMMTREMQKVILAAGGSRTSRHFAHLTSSIRGRLQPIEKAIYNIKHAMCEGVTSADVVPLVWPSGHPYDPASMENLYPEDPSTEEKLKGSPIMGTVDIGVQKVTVTRMRDGTVFRQKDILAKPKVILASTLEEIVETTAKSIRSVSLA